MLFTIKMIQEFTREALLCNKMKKKQPSEKNAKQRKHEILQHPSKEPARFQQKMKYKYKRKGAKTLPRHSKNEMRKFSCAAHILITRAVMSTTIYILPNYALRQQQLVKSW